LKVLQKGKVTIPAKVREALGVEEGDYLTMEFRNGRMIMFPSASVERPTDAIVGLASGVPIKEPLDEEIRKAASARLEKKRR
jgi:AbrB family looped-hinge helix DNA binding protein